MVEDTTHGARSGVPATGVWVARIARWVGLAVVLLGAVFLFLPVTATVDGAPVGCSPAITTGFPSDPGADGLTPEMLACSDAMGPNSAKFFASLGVGLATIVGTSIWLGRHKK